MITIIIKSLIGLVLVLAYLGSVFILAFVFGRAAAWVNDVHPDPLVPQKRTCDQPGDTKLVTPQGGISGDLPASVSPYEESDYEICDFPNYVAYDQSKDESLYAQVDRFDDPEGDL